MVKGISRQVIVVHAPEPKMFEQAIFILKDEALSKDGVTDEALLKEATRLISATGTRKKGRSVFIGPIWACGGAMITGAIWLLSSLL